MTVERRGASIEGGGKGGDDLGERIVIEAGRVDVSVEERNVSKGGEGTWSV